MVTAPRAVGTEGLVRLGVGAFAVVLRLGQVRSVERGDRVRGGDGAPLTITVRGDEFPVFSLADLLHAPDAIPPGTGQVVLTEVARETVGVWAAKVAPVPRTDAATITPAPAFGGEARFREVALLADGPVPVLDLERLFGDPAPDRPTVPARPRKAITDRPTAARLFVLRLFDHPTPGGRRVGFGVSSGAIREIVELGQVQRLAGGGQVTGWTTWQGRVLPVVDPAAWCGVAAPAVESNRAAIVQTDAGSWVAVLTGSEVKSLPGSTPHVRRESWLACDAERIDAALEFHGLTALLLRLTPSR